MTQINYSLQFQIWCIYITVWLKTQPWIEPEYGVFLDFIDNSEFKIYDNENFNLYNIANWGITFKYIF